MSDEQLWTDTDIDKHVSYAESGAYTCADVLHLMRRDYEAERAKLLQRIETLEQQRDTASHNAKHYADLSLELEQQLAEREAWEVMPPGLHFIEGNDDTALTVSLDGSLLTIHATDGELHNALSVQLDPNKYRLCRKQSEASE